MPLYGPHERARIVAVDEGSGGYVVEVTARAQGRRWGPVMSTVPGLEVGDRVLLAQVGTSADEYVIIGRIPGTYPVFSDIPGLQDALDAKADAADLSDLSDTVAGHTATLGTLGDRLDVVEPVVTAHGLAIGDLTLDVVDLEADVSALQSADTALDSRLDSLENYGGTLDPERDLFSDLLSTTSRAGVSAGLTLTNGTICLMRLITRRALSVTQIRMATAVAGTGPGTAVAGVYAGSALTAIPLVGSAAISLTTLGRTTALPSTFVIPAGSNVLIALLPLAFTVGAQIATRPAVVHTSLLNPNAGLATYMTKAGQTVLPATINTTDGTWTISGVHTIWAALGGALI